MCTLFSPLKECNNSKTAIAETHIFKENEANHSDIAATDLSIQEHCLATLLPVLSGHPLLCNPPSPHDSSSSSVFLSAAQFSGQRKGPVQRGLIGCFRAPHRGGATLLHVCGSPGPLFVQQNEPFYLKTCTPMKGNFEAPLEGGTSNIVRNRQNVSRQVSTFYVNSSTAKSVKNRQEVSKTNFDTFQQFCAAPNFRPLLADSELSRPDCSMRVTKAKSLAISKLKSRRHDLYSFEKVHVAYIDFVLLISHSSVATSKGLRIVSCKHVRDRESLPIPTII